MKIDEKLIDPISRVFEVDPNTKNDKPNGWMSAIPSMVLSLYGELHRQGQSSPGKEKVRQLELSGQNFRNLCILAH